MISVLSELKELQSIICPIVSNNPLTNRTMCHDGDEDDDHGDDDHHDHHILHILQGANMFYHLPTNV